MKYYFDTFPTPMGDFSVAVNETGAVVATAFGGPTDLQKCFGKDDLVRDAKLAAEARRQITEFFAGNRRQFTLKLAPRGTPFQKRVWSALEQIPFGETRSYGQVAAAMGNRGAARAVGRANALNPICLLVPCHRVIGTDGSLTGFASGVELKRRLLAHEGAQVQHITASAGWS